jgi:hypothetical protein
MADTRTFVGVLGLVGVITAGIVGFVLWDEDRDSKRRTVEAEAVGFAATPAKWYDSIEEENREGHTLTYAYVGPNNQVFSRKIEEVEWYDSGKRYKVCYNPRDGNDSKLYPSDHVCGQ